MDQFDRFSSGEVGYFERFASRAEILNSIKQKPWCDILVVGGGIHGACFAHLAALQGLNTILLEQFDYGSGSSSRSSKMAHGGLRYLEMFDFRQVFEGIKAREDLFEVASHLVKPHPFLVPIFKEQNWFKFKLRLGLWLYDLFSSKRRHSWISKENLSFEIFNSNVQELSGCFQYFDGLMDDTRLVIEHIIAARQEGARCLNYARVVSLHQGNSGGVNVGFYDALAKASYELRAGIVINCAGAWGPKLGKVSGRSFPVVYSQGSHLLFDRPWKDPALLLALNEKNRYYFIWPHFAGTLVGTTEKVIDEPPADPTPTTDEINEILSRLSHDCPGAGLDRDSLHYCFAGIRTLPLDSAQPVNTANISRRHSWRYLDGVLTLVGGKFTTAAWTVEQGLKIALKLSGTKGNAPTLKGRKLPGAALLNERTAQFKENTTHLPSQVITRIVRYLGGRASYLLEQPRYLEPISQQILRGEIELALAVEQAECLEDIMRRRLALEYMSDHGLPVLPEILKVLKQGRPNIDVLEEEKKYKERLNAIHAVMGKDL